MEYYDKSIDMLNIAAAHCVTAGLQYAFYSLWSENHGFPGLADLFDKLTDENNRNFYEFSARIFYLDGDPEVMPVTAMPRGVKSFASMIALSLETELKTVQRSLEYQQVCRASEDLITEWLFKCQSDASQMNYELLVAEIDKLRKMKYDFPFEENYSVADRAKRREELVF